MKRPAGIGMNSVLAQPNVEVEHALPPAAPAHDAWLHSTM